MPSRRGHHQAISLKRANGSRGVRKAAPPPRVGSLTAAAVRTYPVFMNVTLSIDDRILTRARQLAHSRGTSLNQMIRDYLESLTTDEPSQVMAELERLWSEEEGDSGGWKWNREEVYDRSLLR